MWSRLSERGSFRHIQYDTQRLSLPRIFCPLFLSFKVFIGHGACAQYFRDRHVPLMMLGGGGYTPRNVARCWTYETSIAVNMEVSDGNFYLSFEIS